MMRLLLGILLLAGTLVSAQEPERKKNIAVMNLQPGPGVSAFMINLINEYIGTSVYNSTEYHVISGESMVKLLGHLGKDKLVSCAKKNCLASVGDALGVGKVIGGTIEKAADGYLICLMLVGSESGKLLAYLRETYTADESQLVSQLDTYILQLFEKEKKNLAQQAREREERMKLMRSIVSESNSTQKRISYAAGVARIVIPDVDPVSAADVIKFRYKHARHHFGFDYVSTELEFPDNGKVEGVTPLKQLTAEAGTLDGFGLSYGFEWLTMLNGWVTVIPGITAGSYEYDYLKTIEGATDGDDEVVNLHFPVNAKSAVGGFITVDAGNTLGPAVLEGYYTFKLLYMPDIMTIHEFGGRLSYIIGK